mmetsp:Transcript_44621/g.108167  ORF Transcript_44621/g.108167 Transcript_44621/m.108167 type:complete len:220 (+) Transcript_44621:1740-2399(+)
MALSVRPGNILAISAQRFPRVMCDWRIVRSSSSVQGFLEISGFKWLCHRSRHCFPIRPGRFDAMRDHFFAPYFLTSSTTFRSSSAVQGPLMSDGFNTFCHRWRHWTSLRPWILAAICFQFFAPISSTANRRASSSCLDHFTIIFFPNDPGGAPVPNVSPCRGAFVPDVAPLSVSLPSLLEEDVLLLGAPCVAVVVALPLLLPPLLLLLSCPWGAIGGYP